MQPELRLTELKGKKRQEAASRETSKACAFWGKSCWGGRETEGRKLSLGVRREESGRGYRDGWGHNMQGLGAGRPYPSSPRGDPCEHSGNSRGTHSLGPQGRSRYICGPVWQRRIYEDPAYGPIRESTVPLKLWEALTCFQQERWQDHIQFLERWLRSNTEMTGWWDREEAVSQDKRQLVQGEWVGPGRRSCLCGWTELSVGGVCHFAFLHCKKVSYKLKVCGNPVSSKSISAIFPTAFAHFLSLSHFDNSHNISNPPPAKQLRPAEGSHDNIF